MVEVKDPTRSFGTVITVNKLTFAVQPGSLSFVGAEWRRKNNHAQHALRDTEPPPPGLRLTSASQHLPFQLAQAQARVIPKDLLDRLARYIA